MAIATWILRGLLFVVLLGAMNLAFTGSPVMGIVGAAAAISVYWSLQRAARESA